MEICSYTKGDSKMLKIIEADWEDTNSQLSPGTIVSISKQSINVAAKTGIVSIKRLVPQGKNEMQANAFICGHKLKVGDKLS